MATQTIRDSDWIRQSFMLPENSLTQADALQRTFTTASLKFVNTRLGGNFCINSPPQFTRHADVKIVGRNAAAMAAQSPGNFGMGRMYSEMIDDNKQLIHLGFGVPAYSGMVQFFTGFYNNSAGRMANQGRGTTLFYALGRAAGFVASLEVWPLIAAGYFLRWLVGSPTSKYYYLKSTPGQYWSRVNTICNDLGVNMGLIPRVYSFSKALPDGNLTTTDPETLSGDTSTYGADDIATYNKLAPDIFRAEGGIDVFRVANKAQRAANDNFKALKLVIESSISLADFRARMADFNSKPVNPNDTGARDLGNFNETNQNGVSFNSTPATQLDTYLNSYHTSPSGNVAAGSDNQSSTESDGRDQWKEATAGETDTTSTWTKISGWLEENIGQYIEADLNDGSHFATFKVDYTGTVQETFDNSFKESEIAQKINGFSGTKRESKFSYSGGATGIPGLDSVLGAATDLLSGALDSLHMSGLLSLAGAAFVDIPQHWENSSAQLPTSSYTIELRSWSGDIVSRFQNIYVPLAMLLAAALPISTGKQSYSAPFLCELYSRGRNQIRLGMIQSLSITRGVGNMGWDAEGRPLGIDVSFTIKDLSSVLHIPISNGFSLTSPLDGFSDEDSIYTDYMATLSSLTMAEQIYTSRKLILQISRVYAQLRSQFDVARVSNAVFNGIPGKFLSAFARAGAGTTGN